MQKVSLPALWSLVVSYQIFIIVLLLFGTPSYLINPSFYLPRIIIFVILISRNYVLSKLKTKMIDVFDALLVYILLGFFYGETAYLNTLFYGKIDPWLMKADQWIFGSQPAFLFSDYFNSAFVSELLFMGYFSYYLMPVVALAIIGWKRQRYFRESAFIILTSYFVYYVIFIFLPAEGPQYFWKGSMAAIEAKGVFGWLVKQIQAVGEAPTAAFPSSHVGIALIILAVLSRLKLKVFWFYLPFVVLLVFATVYIKAHYAVDVLGGFISVPLVLYVSRRLYFKFSSANLILKWKSERLNPRKI